MTAPEALQYISTVCGDYARTLPPSAQVPTVQAINAALQTLAPLVNVPDMTEHAGARPHLAAVDGGRD